MTTLVVLAAAAGVVVLALAFAVAMTVDDWRRDLTRNTAATDPNHADPGLRPLELPGDVDAAAERIRAAAGRLSNWRLADDGSAPSADVPAAARRLHFVRTTPLLRFRDDIVVTITAAAASGAVVEVDSRSRVGKADFGQNPRNIKELLSAVSAANERP